MYWCVLMCICLYYWCIQMCTVNIFLKNARKHLCYMLIYNMYWCVLMCICLYYWCILMYTDVYWCVLMSSNVLKRNEPQRAATSISKKYGANHLIEWFGINCITRKDLHYTEDCVTKHGTTRKGWISSKHGITRKEFAIQK